MRIDIKMVHNLICSVQIWEIPKGYPFEMLSKHRRTWEIPKGYPFEMLSNHRRTLI